MGHWESAGIPEDFDGIVRLFPLPNLVLFPHVIQALHIFEPRYCEMLSDALESDRLITMALLTPGWESHYQGKPRLSNITCIGRIISHSPTDDGRHNILLAGMQRARIVEELTVNTGFRQARVELIHDVALPDDDETERHYRDSLLSVFRSMIPQDAANSKTFGDLLTQELPLGVLTDIIGYAVNLPIPVKESLLREPEVAKRYHLLMEHLGPLASDARETIQPATPQYRVNRKGIPPPFSNN